MLGVYTEMDLVAKSECPLSQDAMQMRVWVTLDWPVTIMSHCSHMAG